MYQKVLNIKDIVLTAVCMFSLQAYCQDKNYDYIGKTSENISLYINASTIKAENKYNKQYKVWISGFISDENLPSTQNELAIKYLDEKLKDADMSKMLVYVDCAKEKIFICRTLFYDNNGNVIFDINLCEFIIKYDDVVPESIGDSIYNYVCTHVRKK